MTRLYRSTLLALITLALTAGAALAHQATSLEITTDCELWTATVGYADFGNEHRLRVIVLVDNTVVNDETYTPEGSGELVVTGAFNGTGIVEVIVETPDDDGQSLTDGATFELDCTEPTPAPTPVPLPSPLPSPLAPPASPLLPDTSLAMDAGQPETFTPNWPAGIAAFVLVLVIGLPVAWKLADER